MLGSVPLEPGSGPDIPTDPSPAGIDEPEGGTDMRTIPHNLLDDQEHHGRQFRGSIDCSNDWSSGGLSRLAAISTELMRGLFDGDKSFIRAVACELSRAFYGVVLELKNQKLRTCMERLADWLLRANAKLGDKGQFTIPHDKRTLASGSAWPENLSGILRSLADWGLRRHPRP